MKKRLFVLIYFLPILLFGQERHVAFPKALVDTLGAIGDTFIVEDSTKFLKGFYLYGAMFDTSGIADDYVWSYDAATNKWKPASGASGSGDITAVYTNSPLSGGAVTGDVTISVDTSAANANLATQYFVTSKGYLIAVDYGDSLVNYDGDGIKVTNNDAIDILLDYDSGLEIGDDSLNVKLDGSTLATSSSGLAVNLITQANLTIGGKYISDATPSADNILKYNSAKDSVIWTTDASGAGGSSYSDSLRTSDDTFDADNWFDATGQIDTTTINITQWSDFVNDNSDTSFLMLDDTPSSYSGASDKILQVNSVTPAIEFVTLSGDASLSGGTVIVADDSHNHTGTTISGLDLSDDVNLTVTAPVTLTGDAVGVDTSDGNANLATQYDVASVTPDTTDATNTALATQYDITNLDLSDDVNLTVSAPVVLTDDDVSVDTTGTNSLATRYKIDSLETALRDDFEIDQMQIPIVNPDSISSSKICVFKNYKGSTVTIDSIKLSTDSRTINYVVDVQETLENDTTLSNLIDQVTASQSGTGTYYKTETTISHATIENTNWIWLKLSRTVDVGAMQLTIFYRW